MIADDIFNMAASLGRAQVATAQAAHDARQPEIDRLKSAARELLDLLSDADVTPSTAHNPPEWDTVYAAAICRLRNLAKAEGASP